MAEDLTIDNLKHVYNKSDLLSYAKEYWSPIYQRAIEAGFDENKANEIVYDAMRTWSLDQKDADGILLNEKYPLRNIPTWQQFGDKDTISRGRIAGYDNDPREMSELQFTAGEIDNILADKQTYEPGQLAASFAKFTSQILHDDPADEKQSEMWLLNALGSAQTYFLKEGTMPFPQVADYHPSALEMGAAFFGSAMEGETFVGMMGGSFAGRMIANPAGKYLSGHILKHSPKTLAAYGWGRSFKENLKNIAKKKLGIKYAPLPKNQWGGLATREALIDSGVDFATRNATHFGSWYGFTWYSGYTQNLVQQKWKNIEDGNPDAPLSTQDAMSSATWHSFQEGLKGMAMGYPMHKMAKIHLANSSIAGGTKQLFKSFCW